MVKDINTGADSSDPNYLTNAKGTVFFSADDGVVGVELWKSTGTTPNTVLVRDIGSGAFGSSPHEITNIKGNVFFAANDGTNGIEIWKSNGSGSASGTFLVKDIRSGALGSNPGFLLNLNGLLVFAANDGTSGTELHRSNGQVAGTVRVKDINVGAGSSDPANFYNLNSTLFFSANNGTSGVELWRSTAFGPGTLLAADINSGAGSSNPTFLSSSFTTLFFAANDGINGNELWTLSNPLPPAPFMGLLTQNDTSLDGNIAAAFEVSASLPSITFASQPAQLPRSQFANAKTSLPRIERTKRSNAAALSRDNSCGSLDGRGSQIWSDLKARSHSGPRFAYEGVGYYLLDADMLRIEFDLGRSFRTEPHVCLKAADSAVTPFKKVCWARAASILNGSKYERSTKVALRL